MTDRELENALLREAILAELAKPHDGQRRLSDLSHLSPHTSDDPVQAAYRRERHVDRELQRLRRKGLIAYMGKLGWRLVEGGGTVTA